MLGAGTLSADDGVRNRTTAPNVGIEMVRRAHKKPWRHLDFLTRPRALQDSATVNLGRYEWLRTEPVEIDDGVLEHRRVPRGLFELL